MPVLEYGELRGNFVRAHPDAMLADFKEHHKKFLERSRRDVIVNEVVPACELGEVPSQDRGCLPAFWVCPLGRSTSSRGRVDLPAAATLEDDPMNRVHAVMVAFSWTNTLSGPTTIQVWHAGSSDRVREAAPWVSSRIAPLHLPTVLKEHRMSYMVRDRSLKS